LHHFRNQKHENIPSSSSRKTLCGLPVGHIFNLLSHQSQLPIGRRQHEATDTPPPLPHTDTVRPLPSLIHRHIAYIYSIYLHNICRRPPPKKLYMSYIMNVVDHFLHSPLNFFLTRAFLTLCGLFFYTVTPRTVHTVDQIHVSTGPAPLPVKIRLFQKYGLIVSL
jgi:hypothetical protein